MTRATQNPSRLLDKGNTRRLVPVLAPPSVSTSPAHPVLQLQQLLGNRLVNRVLATSGQVSAPTDSCERDADRLANQIVSRIDSIRGSTCRPRDSRPGQSQSTTERPTRGSLRHQAIVDGTSASKEQLSGPDGGGRSLPEPIRTAMEDAFCEDFRDVRIHVDARSRQLNHLLGARAFTIGSDIFFRHAADVLGPMTSNQLIAHELAHVLQQRKVTSFRDTIQRAIYLANEDDCIYKSEDIPGEFAFLEPLHSQGKLPMFINYHVIDGLKADNTIAGLWKKYNCVAEFVKSDLVELLKGESPKAVQIKAVVGQIYLYNKDAGALQPLVASAQEMAMAIVAVCTRGPKRYQMGGGSRLPKAFGILTTYKLSKEKALTILGISRDKIGDYARIVVHNRSNYSLYESELKTARASGQQFFDYYDMFTNANMFYVSAVDVTRSQNAKIQVNNVRYTDVQFNSIDPMSVEATEINDSFNALGLPVADSGWVPGTNITKKPRGEGQAKAMNYWNAFGAAAYANRFLHQTYPLDQNWEWLHIRGAQIGGATDPTNLVPGLYVTNSFMIPYESMILKWAQADAGHFWVKFAVLPPNTRFPRWICLSIMAKNHKNLLDLPEQVLIQFDVLQGRVIDKLANEFVKRAIDRKIILDVFK